MTEELELKIDRAIRLIRSAGADGSVVGVAYSGGKDSDVVLELTRMAGINHHAVYYSTTIDPPGTIKHVQENGAEIRRPEKTFFQLIAENGMPNRFQRSCCRLLKERKIADKTIFGIRKAESTKREQNYTEPTECRIYKDGRSKETSEAFYPILYWTDDDVAAFIAERGIKVHSLYYREDGTVDPSRRLGCMCCPLQYYKKRIASFKEHPGMVRAYIRAAQKYMSTHPESSTVKKYSDVYEWFVREVFFERQGYFEDHKTVTQFTPPITRISLNAISA